MTWTKLSDDYSDDTWTLTNAGYRLHTDGLLWSNRKLLDLRIPRGDLARFSQCPEAVQELLDSGFWREDGPEHYRIIHHGMYQRTREQVIKQQEANQANGKRGGRPPANPKPSGAETESLTESLTESVTESVTEGEAPETHSLSESQTETESERDRTGQDSVRELKLAGTSSQPAHGESAADCSECQRRFGMGGKPECPVIARGAVCPFPALDAGQVRA